ncbi:MAG: hypothetical protein NC408_05155 [Candidatus Gastranaerophilales bacterium]|nr:hypothetical protein [Candidatus Gastranaerophilales bacterium]MCM1072959.1 hypothetical protein [Bacteroides sp.]
MNIQPTSCNNFKGYDARYLRGFLMSANCYGIADEMYKIGQEEGFRIYSPFGGLLENKCDEIVPPYTTNGNLWAQDYWTIVKDKLLTLKETDPFSSILKFFNLRYDITEKCTRETPRFMQINQDIFGMFADIARQNPEDIKERFIAQKDELNSLYHKAHIPGGNLFIVKDGKQDSVFVGKNELAKYDIEDIQAMYGVDKVIVLPQMDYHLDLFIRPLDNKRILLADDKISVETLYKGLDKLKAYITMNPFEDTQKYKEAYNTMLKFIRIFEAEITLNNRAQTDEIEKILSDNDFEVIRVPGRIYETEPNSDGDNFLKQYCNFINANALKNRFSELVYITNKSNIDERLGLTPEMAETIGFSFEKEFINSISPYVNPEHIYFVDGDKNFISKIMLTEYQGGIHCTCSEVPL